MKRFTLVLLLALAGLSMITQAADEAAKFPHRAKFKQVAIIDAEKLHAQLDQVVVVDVRTRYEYDTLHIQGARHIPLAKETLPAAIKKLRAETRAPIVFYCNGTTCKKSYEATDLALAAGVQNVFAYDAGLDAWSTRYPEKSVLMQKGPASTEQLISKDRFKSRVISATDFEARLEKGAIVLDIRDRRHRDYALFPFKEERAQLDDSQKLAEVVAAAKRANKPLLVYDKVGKQIRWFQYYLEQHGVKNYYFLAGGSEGYHEAKFGKLAVPMPDQS